MSIHFLLRRKTGVTLKYEKEKWKAVADHKQNSDGQHRFFFNNFYTLFRSVPLFPYPNATHWEHGWSDVVDSKEKPFCLGPQNM